MSVKLFFPCHKCYKNGQSLYSKVNILSQIQLFWILGKGVINNLSVTLFIIKKGTTFKNFNPGLILASPHNDYVTIRGYAMLPSVLS